MRLVNISIVHVISMLTIVAYHCMCYNAGIWADRYNCPNVNMTITIIARFLVFLALPMFFFISGYIYALNYRRGKYRGFIPFMRRKFERLIIPVVTYSFIYIVAFKCEYTPLTLISGMCHLWFLPTLFCCFIIIYPFSDLCTTDNKIISSGGGILFVMLLWALFKDLPCYGIPLLSAFLRYSLYFVIGVVGYSFMHRTSMKLIYVTIVLFISMFVHGKAMWSNNIYMVYADTISIIVFCMSLVKLFTLIKVKENPIIKFLDKNSMGVYLIHQPLIFAIYDVSRFEDDLMTYNPYIFIPILFVFVFFTSIMLSHLKYKLRLEPYF